MDDDMTTPDPEPEAPEEAPEAEPVEDMTAKAEELAKKERDLQRGFDEIARRERELVQRSAPPPEPTPDPYATWDESVRTPLKQTIEAEVKQFVAPLQSENEALKAALADSALDRYASGKGVDAGEMRDWMRDSGLNPAEISPTQYDAAFDAAYKIMRAEKFDEGGIEAEVEKRLAAKLEEMQAQGVSIESIRPQRSEPGGPSEVDPDEMSTEEYARFLKEKRKG